MIKINILKTSPLQDLSKLILHNTNDLIKKGKDREKYSY